MQQAKEKLKKQLAKKINSYRLKTGKSISILSNEVNLSKSIWSDLEKGKKDPQFSTLWRIAESLDIPLSKIVLELEEELKGQAGFID